MQVLYYLLATLGMVVGYIAGWLTGRWYERYRLYTQLLSSRNPSAWTAAHHVSRKSKPPAPPSDPFLDPTEDDSGMYAPTPAGSFPALVDPHAPTRKDGPPQA